MDRVKGRKGLNILLGLSLVSGFYPIYRGWRGTAGTTLRHAVVWGALAWAGWCGAVLLLSPALRYLALCLTACAGVAVLGARRPGVGAWNLVVAGLLVALCRPFLEGRGELRLEGAHIFFLACALAVALGNYLPTRQAPAVLVLGIWAVLELAQVETPPALALLLASAPWLALFSSRKQGEDFDGLWRRYRDQFGFVWAQRLREQFNRSAANAGWNVALGWSGLHSIAEGEQPEPERLLLTLRALLKRFEREQD
jgi:hypothetical protein